MTIRYNVDASLSLSELQKFISDNETGDGPLEIIEQGTGGGSATTAIEFDDAVIADAPVTTLLLSGQVATAGLVPYARGTCLLQGSRQEVIGFVPMDEIFLVRRVVSLLSGLGWTANQAIGIAANIKGESSFDPHVIGDGGAAYGLCQWHTDRQARFKGHFNIAIRGSTFREQLLFIDRELRTAGEEKPAGDLLMQAVSPEDAAEVFCRQYERPLDKDGGSTNRRAFATAFKESLK